MLNYTISRGLNQTLNFKHVAFLNNRVYCYGMFSEFSQGIFIPDIVQSQVIISMADSYKGVLGVRNPCALDVRSKVAVTKSLDAFLQRSNVGIDQAVRGQFRRDVNIRQDFFPEGKFILSPAFSRRAEQSSYWQYYNLSDQTTFFMDGDFAFALGFQVNNGKAIWLDATSFCFGHRLHEYFDSTPKKVPPHEPVQ